MEDKNRLLDDLLDKVVVQVVSDELVIDHITPVDDAISKIVESNYPHPIDVENLRLLGDWLVRFCITYDPKDNSAEFETAYRKVGGPYMRATYAHWFNDDEDHEAGLPTERLERINAALDKVTATMVDGVVTLQNMHVVEDAVRWAKMFPNAGVSVDTEHVIYVTDTSWVRICVYEDGGFETCASLYLNGQQTMDPVYTNFHR